MERTDPATDGLGPLTGAGRADYLMAMMRKTALTLGVASLLGCATGPDVNVSGLWDLTEIVSSQTGISCDAVGELLLSQSSNGSRFTGQRTRTGTCTGAPAGFTIAGAHNLIGGEVNGTRVSFEVDFCDYEGDVVTDSEMSGSFSCPDGISQEPVLFTGTWRATR